MRKIKSFGNFINEDSWGSSLLGAWDTYTKSVAQGAKPEANKVEKVDKPTTPTPSPTVSTTANNVAAADLSALNAVPGNDDFVLYMQHQQGIGGAKGLIQAAAGVGEIHPETLKVKNCSHLGGRVPYANLQCNIPSDRPQYKKDIVAALNNKDQKTGATLFLKMWKEKWAAKSQQAKAAINKPEYAALKQAIVKNCSQQGVPFDFAVTVAYIESGFNPKSGNSAYKGVYALSQSEFSKYVPGGNIYNMEDNVKAGIMCLKNNIKEFTKYLGPLIAKVEVGSWAKSLA